LIKSGSKDIFKVTKDLFTIHSVLLNFLFINIFWILFLIKYEAAQMFSTLIIMNNIRMISEGSCDTED